MKVLVLGATGRTGKLILDELVKRGHMVNALVRDKNKIKLTAESLTVFEGSTLDENILNKAAQGCDAIISALNISRNNDFPWAPLRTPADFLSATIKNVIKAAHQNKITRVVVLSAWGVNETITDVPFWFKWIINNSNISFAYRDHELQEQLLAATDLCWTVIRPVGLTNFDLKPVKVSINNNPKPGLLISRKSVAVFIVNVVLYTNYIKLSPVIYN